MKEIKCRDCQESIFVGYSKNPTYCAFCSRKNLYDPLLENVRRDREKTK